MTTDFDRDDHILRLECDKCGTEDEFDGDTFQEAWADAKADGWRAYKDDSDEWCHSCPNCNNPYDH